MKICDVGNYKVKVFTRDEHCPPHVHVYFDKGEMRFIFSFVHNDVRIWDTKPIKNELPTSEINKITIALKQKEILDLIRKRWYESELGTCLKNKYWDLKNEMVADKVGSGTSQILNASYNVSKAKCNIILKDYEGNVEVTL